MPISRMGSSVSRDLLVGLISTGIYFFASQLIMSVLARYSRDLGIDVASTSFVWSLLSLVAFILRPLAGYMADRTNSYLAMSLGCLFMVIAAIMYLFSSSLNELITGRIVQGVAAAYFISPSIAAVATAAGIKAGMALGIRSMLISLTSIVVPPLAGALVDSIGYSPVFIMTALLAGFLVILNALEAKRIGFKYVNRSFRSGWREALNKIVALVTITALFNGILFLTLTGILQAHYRDLGYEAKIYGYFMMFFGLSSIVSRYIAGKLSSQKNPALIATIGHIITTASIYMLKHMYYAPLSYIVALIYGFGIGLTIPTQQLLVAYSVPESARNRAVSIYAMGFDLGGFIGPLIYGSIASIYGYIVSYQYLVLIPLVSIALMTYLAIKLSSGELRIIGIRI
ncbi:MAG: hypothetical protein B6U85_08090 [Desulfurococcales archaeon ex4484_42]|nr:MAG: hypothetical protein B6U85_08090 [Desulfurococcales archaeon ex4484_42]